MRTVDRYTGSVRLVDKKTRVVEVLGPEPPGARYPTDRKLLYQPDGPDVPRPVGFCFQADGRRARFLIDKSFAGEGLLDLLAKHPKAPTRLAKPYGAKGWVVEE